MAFAAALAAAALAGCSRDEGAGRGAVSPGSPESYMKDGAFRAKLDAQTAERARLAGARATIVERMVEMVEAKKRELGTGDEAKLKAALEKDPAWNELYRRCQDADAAIGENRGKTISIVRERLARRNNFK